LPGVSAAIGVAEFPATAGDAAALLEAADEAMAMARAGGSRSPSLAGPRSCLSVVRRPSSVVR
jgi:GGDEF domain-containing protein